MGTITIGTEIDSKYIWLEAKESQQHNFALHKRLPWKIILPNKTLQNPSCANTHKVFKIL